jgi:hypothetical protein
MDAEQPQRASVLAHDLKHDSRPAEVARYTTSDVRRASNEPRTLQTARLRERDLLGPTPVSDARGVYVAGRW